MPPKEIRPGWTPREMAGHYHTPRDLDGRGEIAAVIDLGEIVDRQELLADIRKLGGVTPEVEIIDDGSPPDPALSKAAIETHMDMEVLGSLCPKAQLRLYRCALDFSAMAKAIRAAVKDGVHVISISWAAAEQQLSSGTIAEVEAALNEAAMAGVTVCAAAGDFGASGQADPETGLPANASGGRVSCMYPASSPQVLACGGTELVEEKGKRHEVVWNNTATGGLATGGGVSAQFDRPGWQKGLRIGSANPGAAKGRILPDVAALAAARDWDFVIPGASPRFFGGTSAVAPFFAALIVMANQLRTRNGKKRLGFLNSRLYDVASNRGGEFHSIRSGNNRVAPDGRGYDAKKGFDACTGWGIPRADRLVRALAELP